MILLFSVPVLADIGKLVSDDCLTEFDESEGVDDEDT
jgi:hypothetical protein